MASASSQTLSGEERALLALLGVGGIGATTLASLKAAFGSLEEALRADRSRLVPHLRFDEARRNLLAAGPLLSRVDAQLEALGGLGGRVLFPGTREWPRQLAGLAFPAALYVLGTLAPAARRAAIVGSRASDPYGLELARGFSTALADAGVEIVSGGALGVDATAHRAALDAGGKTIAVVGSGLDKPYPAEHRRLYDEVVARGGAVVSLFPPGVPPASQNFVVRNKLIAAVSDAVLVARAGETSGALGTARAAKALGRPVFAIPGDTTSPLSLGGNRLLEEEGARVATRPEPLLKALGLSGSSIPRPPPSVEAEPPAVALPDALAEVWQALGADPIQFDELGRRCNLSPGALAASLLQLELRGLTAERPGKLYVRTGGHRMRIQEERKA